MVVPIVNNNLHEINFLKNHPLGPRLSSREIAANLELSEIEIDALLKSCVENDYGGCEQELNWLQNHPLGPKYSGNCGSSVKIALGIAWNFVIIIAIYVCDQLPLIQDIFKILLDYYTQMVDIVSEYVSESHDEAKYGDTVYLNNNSYYNLINDSSFDDTQLMNTTGEAWITADLSGLSDSDYVDEISLWKAEFLEIFALPEIVHELYDNTMTHEMHQMNMVLASLETHLANGYHNGTAESVLMIRAKHYREWFIKVFPVAIDDFLLNMVYTTDLTFARHIDMMNLALRTKYSQ